MFDPASPSALLLVEETRRADAMAVAAGTPSITLMERAGAAVAAAIAQRWSARPVLVLCGPGANGGDGYVTARVLAAAGWEVRVASTGGAPRSGDAARAASRWDGPVEPLGEAALEDCALLVDALFGAGLAREVDGPARALLQDARRRSVPIVAIDLPSGLDGDSAQVRGFAPTATLTVTFFRKKLAHVLQLGMRHCGEIVLADIGIPDTVLAAIAPSMFENGPALWADRIPWPGADTHKYRRGHAVVLGGGVMTGASRLAAHAAARMGAGLVTLAVPSSAWAIYAGWRADLLVETADDGPGWQAALADPRRNVALLGPGAGRDARLAEALRISLGTGKKLVLDADALRLLADPAHVDLRAGLNGDCLLTPHAGEFARLFPGDGAGASEVETVRTVARDLGATILRKGADTVLADPAGTLIVSNHGSPDLATAGTGDVLAGMALGLAAQGLDLLNAGAIAAWVHGEAGRRFGAGLVAEDLAPLLPAILAELRAGRSGKL